MKNLLIKQSAGFTLMEIVAILFVVSIGLMGVLSLINQNIRIQGMNEERIIANQLAQEGVELVRNIRDENWNQGDPWDDGLVAGNFIIDYTASSTTPVGSISEATLQIQDSGDYTNFYLHNVLEENSIYRRMIIISDVASSSMRIQSQVQWDDRTNTYDHITETMLYDWR